MSELDYRVKITYTASGIREATHWIDDAFLNISEEEGVEPILGRSRVEVMENTLYLEGVIIDTLRPGDEITVDVEMAHGWETISLPADVEKIEIERTGAGAKGRVVPGPKGGFRNPGRRSARRRRR